MQNVEKLSAGRVRLAAGTLYGALNTMQEKGWIAVYSNDIESRKKEYLITDEGIQILETEIKRLKELLENGEMLLGEQS